MSVLVTGAGGFLGCHLVRSLAAGAPRPVVAVRRSSSATDATGVIEWIGDLSVPGWTESLPAGVECVVHLAQSSRYREFPEGAVDMARINLSATAELLEWSRLRGVRRFVLASTGSVYGPAAGLLSEDGACEPTTYYAATKLGAEHVARQYDRYFAVAVLRLFTIYGPGQQNMLMPRLIERVRSGATITLARGPGMYLTPLYVDDAIAFITRLCDPAVEPTQGLYNLAGTDVVELSRIVQEIERGVGRAAVIEKTDDEVRWLAGSNAKICAMTGLTPRIGIEQGIRNVVTESGRDEHRAKLR